VNRALVGAPVPAIVVMLIFVLMAIFAPLIAPYPPNEIQLSDSLLPPAWQEGGSSTYLLGTDKLGRDILSRIIYGARISLLTAGISILAGGLIGISLGLLAAYGGQLPKTVIMRLADVMLATPLILLALLFAVVFGASFLNLVAVIVLAQWAGYARQAYAEAISIQEREFVIAARACGASGIRIVLTHVFPNLASTMVILATLTVASVILVEASLSFLGLGIPPPEPSWGRMISEGRHVLRTAWWVATIPGIVLTLVVFSSNLFGDWLRDYLDPTLRHVRK
jgi:peptide/nickel transport system permease protein